MSSHISSSQLVESIFNVHDEFSCYKQYLILKVKGLQPLEKFSQIMAETTLNSVE